MKRVFLYSDPHFGHDNICKFTTSDGKKLRPWDDVKEMNQELVRLWNLVVSPEDTVWVLGDVAWTEEDLRYINDCKGRKILVAGNHDLIQTSTYLKYFDRVVGCIIKGKRIFTHYPVHPNSLEFRLKQNIHGHLHEKVVWKDGVPDERYVNVSAERTDFRPIPFESLPPVPKRDVSTEPELDSNGSGTSVPG